MFSSFTSRYSIKPSCRKSSNERIPSYKVKLLMRQRTNKRYDSRNLWNAKWLTLSSFIWPSLTLDIPSSAIISGRQTRPPSEAMWMHCWKNSHTFSIVKCICKRKFDTKLDPQYILQNILMITSTDIILFWTWAAEHTKLKVCPFIVVSIRYIHRETMTLTHQKPKSKS